jgi:hypothetical protein
MLTQNQIYIITNNNQLSFGMGKKRITNRFAATKRIISSHDQRTYFGVTQKAEQTERRRTITRKEGKNAQTDARRWITKINAI